MSKPLESVFHRWDCDEVRAPVAAFQACVQCCAVGEASTPAASAPASQAGRGRSASSEKTSAKSRTAPATGTAWTEFAGAFPVTRVCIVKKVLLILHTVLS